MKLDIEAMRKALKYVYDNTYLTIQTAEQIEEFCNEYSSLDVFDEHAKEELESMFWNTIEPAYRSYSGGKTIPNVFAVVSPEEEER